MAAEARQSQFLGALSPIFVLCARAFLLANFDWRSIEHGVGQRFAVQT